MIKPEIYAPEIESKYDFNHGFLNCCRTLKKRVRDDYDAVVAITGEEGISKSTLANHIGFKVDKNYTLETNCLFAPKADEIVSSIRRLPRFSAINADEAIKILYKQQWWLQVFINKFYRLCRQDNKISIMCMPRFSEFNEGFRNHRILFWIHLLDRGIGVVFQKDWSPFCSDPWWFDKNQKALSDFSRRRKFHTFTMEYKIKILQRSANFLDVITFPDLDPEIREKYKQLAAAHKYEGIEEEYQTGLRESILKKRYNERLKKLVEALQSRTGMSQREVAKIAGVTQPVISAIVSKNNKQ